MMTPAIILNGEAKVAGRVAAVEEKNGMLKE